MKSRHDCYWWPGISRSATTMMTWAGRFISGPNARVAQREHWEWRMTFSIRYNVAQTALCKLTNRWQTWVNSLKSSDAYASHDDVIKWKHFPRYWPFVWGIHRSPVNSPHKGQWRGALISFTFSWINGWVNNRKAGDWRRHHAPYDVTVMIK